MIDGQRPGSLVAQHLHLIVMDGLMGLENGYRCAMLGNDPAAIEFDDDVAFAKSIAFAFRHAGDPGIDLGSNGCRLVGSNDDADGVAGGYAARDVAGMSFA